jgi:hypothetical protein
MACAEAAHLLTSGPEGNMTVDSNNTIFDLLRFSVHHAPRRLVNRAMFIGGALFLSRTMFAESLALEWSHSSCFSLG